MDLHDYSVNVYYSRKTIKTIIRQINPTASLKFHPKDHQPAKPIKVSHSLFVDLWLWLYNLYAILQQTGSNEMMAPGPNIKSESDS